MFCDFFFWRFCAEQIFSRHFQSDRICDDAHDKKFRKLSYDISGRCGVWRVTKWMAIFEGGNFYQNLTIPQQIFFRKYCKEWNAGIESWMVSNRRVIYMPSHEQYERKLGGCGQILVGAAHPHCHPFCNPRGVVCVWWCRFYRSATIHMNIE